jgi:two-component system phosphate regulon response regulator PhoB
MRIPRQINTSPTQVDDYVTKPFSMRELVLRIRALGRRTEGRKRADGLAVGALWIDRAARRAQIDGVEVKLRRLEFDLLVCLAEAAGAAVSRAQLVRRLWSGQEPSSRVVDTTIKRLRKRLGPRAPSIRTVRGHGYSLMVE